MEPTADQRFSPANERPPIRVAVAVVEQERQLLIGPRPPGAPLAGLWEFPGGKILPGESPEEAARRECLEETGLSVSVVDRYPIAAGDYAHGRVEIFFLACRVEDPRAAPQAPFRWVPAAALGDYEFPSANAELVRQLIARWG